MTLQAGSAASLYTLDISGVRKAVAEAKQELASLRAEAAKPLPVPRVPRQQTAPAAATPAASANPAAAIAQQRLEAATLKTASARNTAANAAQRLATEEQRTAREVANAAAAQDRAAKTALQLAAAQQRAAAQQKNSGLGPALPRTFAGFTPGGLAQLGLAASIPQLVNFGVESGKASIALDRQLRVTKELAGSQLIYNQVIAAAKTQQELYGGSLQENIAGIQGLVVTSRSTGAELETLINLAQRLAVLDPAQGAEGARIALSEILAGDPRSLARRYEIPLSALERIKDESIPVAERLKILDDYLSKIGITSGVVTSTVTDQAKTYNQLSAALDKASVSAGGYLATLGQAPAKTLTAILTVDERKLEKQSELLDKAKGDYAAYSDAIGAINDSGRVNRNIKVNTGNDIIQIEGLTKAQFEYVQVLRTQGVATDQAAAKAQSLAPVFDGIAAAQQRLQNTSVATPALLKGVGDQILRVATSSDSGRVASDGLVAAYLAGGLSIDQLIAALTAYEQRQGAATRATQDEEREQRRLKGAFDDTSTALQKAIQENVKAQVESNKLGVEQRALERDSLAAGQGLLGAGDQAELLAARYKITADEARNLIAEQQRIAGISARGLADQRKQEQTGTTDSAEVHNTLSKIAAQKRERDRQEAKQAAAEANRLADSQLNLELSAAKTNAQKIAIYKRQLAKTTDQIERNQLQATINSLQNSGGAGGSAPIKGLSTLDRSELALIDDAQTKLADVNRRLAAGNLTQLQRNQLLKQQRDLQREIADESRRELEDQLSLQESLINNRKAQREEERNLKLLGRLAQRGGDRGQAAADEIALIDIVRRRRNLNIDRLQETTGGALPLNPNLTPPNVVSAGASPLTASQQPQSAGTSSGLTVNLNINGRTIATEIIPDILSALRGGIAGARNAGT